MSCFQIPKANLVLKMCDLPPPGVETSQGFTNADRTRMTWKNVNMRTLLGDLYDTHDLFNLKLDSVTLGYFTYNNEDVRVYIFGENDSDRIVSLEMEGLQFINNTYDTKSGNNTSSAVLGSYYFDFNKPIVDYNNNSTVTFHKCNMCDLTITYKTIVDNTLPTTFPGNAFPKMMFHFSLYGIDCGRPKPQRLINMSM